MSSIETVFISRVTAEFGSLASRIKDASQQQDTGIHAFDQSLDRMGTVYKDSRLTAEKLVDWIRSSDAVYHLAGLRYGTLASAPENADLLGTFEQILDGDERAQQRLRDDWTSLNDEFNLKPSYTQVEFLLARALRKDVLVILAGEENEADQEQKVYRSWLTKEKILKGQDRLDFSSQSPESAESLIEAQLVNRLLRRSLALSASIVLDDGPDVSMETRLGWLTSGKTAMHLPPRRSETAFRALLRSHLAKPVLWTQRDIPLGQGPAHRCWRAEDASEWLLEFDESVASVWPEEGSFHHQGNQEESSLEAVAHADGSFWLLFSKGSGLSLRHGRNRFPLPELSLEGRQPVRFGRQGKLWVIRQGNRQWTLTEGAENWETGKVQAAENTPITTGVRELWEDCEKPECEGRTFAGRRPFDGRSDEERQWVILGGDRGSLVTLRRGYLADLFKTVDLQLKGPVTFDPNLRAQHDSAWIKVKNESPPHAALCTLPLVPWYHEEPPLLQLAKKDSPHREASFDALAKAEGFSHPTFYELSHATTPDWPTCLVAHDKVLTASSNAPQSPERLVVWLFPSRFDAPSRKLIHNYLTTTEVLPLPPYRQANDAHDGLKRLDSANENDEQWWKLLWQLLAST